jgi:seryl-tRNA synthetase
VCLSTGDLSFAAAKCYDLEAWAPGLNQFLEVSSCSNFEAFQARRAGIRYRQAVTKKTAYVHTLNGSGVALARTLICLLETHQQADGHIAVPQVLRPYLDGQATI